MTVLVEQSCRLFYLAMACRDQRAICKLIYRSDVAIGASVLTCQVIIKCFEIVPNEWAICEDDVCFFSVKTDLSVTLFKANSMFCDLGPWPLLKVMQTCYQTFLPYTVTHKSPVAHWHFMGCTLCFFFVFQRCWKLCIYINAWFNMQYIHNIQVTDKNGIPSFAKRPSITYWTELLKLWVTEYKYRKMFQDRIHQME